MGEGEEQLAGCRKETAQSKGGVSYSRQCRGPMIYPPSNSHPHRSKNYSCNRPDEGKMALEQVNSAAQPVHCVQTEVGMFPRV